MIAFNGSANRCAVRLRLTGPTYATQCEAAPHRVGGIAP